MNDIAFAAYVLDHHRASDLARENELLQAHREHGWSPTRPRGRSLAAWFRAAAHRGHRATVAPSH